jgi:hypothetical protein
VNALEPIRRFWWLLLIAFPVAVIAGVLVLYEVRPLASGPLFTSRNEPTYQASVQVLVNSASNPYLQAPTDRESPEGKALIDAANYLPFIIQSDRVAELRRERQGDIPGFVSASALFARETNRGLNESSIPIIEVSAFSPNSASAVRLANGTVSALMVWLTSEQNKSKIVPAGRILLEPLRSPEVVKHQESSYGLAVLVFAVVLVGFTALAWMLDRVFPPAGAARVADISAAAPLHDSTAVSMNGGAIGDESPESTSDEEAEATPASQRRWA